MKLSVNLNKIALLRNARGENYPNIEYFANRAIEIGVDGLTLHPRPDHRHATSNDVVNLSKLTKERGVEFNIEGNPFSKPNGEFMGFCELTEIIKPDQTLVEKKMILKLEKEIDFLEEKNGIPEFFVVPGENEISAKFDWARVVSRRAERKCVRWQRNLEIDDSQVVIYLNRLSDLLWMLAREFENDWTPSR